MLKMLQVLTRVFTGKRFWVNPKAPRISETDKKALLVGLINGEQIMSYCNSLATGLPKGRMREDLYKWYEITDPEGAVSILDWLLNEGHRTVYNEIFPVIKTVTGADARRDAIVQLYNERFRQEVAEVVDDAEAERIKEKFEGLLSRAVEFGDNLKGCVNGPRANHPFVAFNDENLSKGISAWDFGRLVTVARSAFSADYIDEQTAWGYIREAYRLTIQEYSNWKEVAAAYLVGRGMWGGDTMMLDGLYGIAEDCIAKEDSPWKTTSLK